MGFAAGEEQWIGKLGRLRDVVRQELVTRQLAAHLPPGPARVLDVGCGQGTQALRVARAGHDVTAFDSSRRLLDLLEAAVEPGMRVTTVQGDAGELAGLVEAGGFDVVLCHGVLMYFDDPGPLIEAMAGALRPGGLLSLLVRNGDALAMRPGLLHDWGAARRGFSGEGYLNRLGVTARADRREELTERLAVRGLKVGQWYGVRVFTDVTDAAEPPEDFDELLACEELAGRTDPYRSVAALTHLLATLEV
ncbi:class I SAM-dependent methyltransferase [Nonomuraea sp. NPDC050663]|uniref:class I SAM-dependent methyltransferase n=1 Tax=Nonomuraea sp. NPDC050663 TaxID=3364370 RepID=UPI0037B2CC29